MDPLVTAIAGGSVGAILTMLAGVPTAVRQHDGRVQELDDDLAQWVADECVQLEREIRGLNVKAGRGTHDGSHLARIAHAKEVALHRYRDQERRARALRAELLSGEGARHRIWRALTRRRRLADLKTPDVAQPVLDGWREHVRNAPVSDPTRRPLTPWAIDKYGVDANPWEGMLPPDPDQPDREN